MAPAHRAPGPFVSARRRKDRRFGTRKALRAVAPEMRIGARKYTSKPAFVRPEYVYDAAGMPPPRHLGRRGTAKGIQSIPRVRVHDAPPVATMASSTWFVLRETGWLRGIVVKWDSSMLP
jgi:hypothetical protein